MHLARDDIGVIRDYAFSIRLFHPTSTCAPARQIRPSINGLSTVPKSSADEGVGATTQKDVNVHTETFVARFSMSVCVEGLFAVRGTCRILASMIHREASASKIFLRWVC